MDHLSSQRSAFSRVHWPVVILFIASTVAALGLVSPYALLSSVVDVLAAAFVIVPLCFVGLSLVPRLWLGDLPLRWHILFGAALGIGGTALLVLILGCAGFLSRGWWIVILAAFVLLGVLRLRNSGKNESDNRRTADEHSHMSFLWLLLVPFLVLTLLAAAHAPGFLWREEGNGYDVLEYHLQLPKEYHQEGQITYLPHNVYANFPANVEMLYLLAMIVHRNVYDIGTTANVIHLILGALAVYAAWLVAREWSSVAGLLSALALGTVGWIGYLSGLAYVENGLLFFGMAAVATVLRGVTLPDYHLTRRWILIGGLLAGLACGCKYTALAMVALPLAVALLVAGEHALRRRVGCAAWFLTGCAVAVAPWLIKNTAMTGNPVFPLCNSVFQAFPEGWGPAEQERWDRGHSVKKSERSLGARLHALWRHVPGDRYQRFGPAILVLAAAGLVARPRGRADAVVIVVLIVQIVAWLWLTHLYARFAVPMLIPLAVLVGRSVGTTNRRMAAVTGAVVLGAAWNSYFAIRLHSSEGVRGAPASLFYEGRQQGFEYLGYINKELPSASRLLMVGDARAFYIQRPVDYTVVFNSNPFVTVVEDSQQSDPVIDWLRTNKFSHVLVHWAEIERLSRSYGFSNRITPERFSELASSGLKRVRRFPHPSGGGRYVDFYEVPPARPSQPMSNRP